MKYAVGVWKYPELASEQLFVEAATAHSDISSSAGQEHVRACRSITQCLQVLAYGSQRRYDIASSGNGTPKSEGLLHSEFVAVVCTAGSNEEQ